jgi:phosphatidate cytidylyltransferase
MTTPADPSTGASQRWADLRPRLISAAVMLAVGAVEVWLGGWPFLVLIMVLVGAMIWEVARMSRPDAPKLALAFGALAALLMFADEGWPNWTAWVLAPIIPILFLIPFPKGVPWNMAKTCAAMSLAVMAVGHGIFELRQTEGAMAILWVLSVVVVSDVAGYFVGRSLGGPKFWPAISPKKTWSGTLAGWIGAALLGAGYVAMGYGSAVLIAASVVIAFAGQMGDIAESWIKRRAGVKDSSHLIPGHGGVLDLFDAVIGAMLAVMALQWLAPSFIRLGMAG